jgi:PAS domain S-box-containing protein
MAKARDTGATTIAARVILVQETDRDPQYGMLMYVPSYRREINSATLEERRTALRGFVYSPIRMNDFVRGTLNALPSDIDFEIFAGDPGSADSLMFSSKLFKDRDLPEDYQPALSTARMVEAYGINWQFTFSTRPTFYRELTPSRPLATLLTGILTSFLLSVLAFLQARSRRQALVIADHMTQQLAAQQRLALHIEQAPLAAIEWDDHFQVTAWNRAAEKIFGYSAEEAIGAHASFILPEQADLPRVVEDLFQTTGTSYNRSRNITKDGKIIECDWYNTKLVNRSGAVIGVASLAQDITERLQAETQVRETMEQLKQATEAAEKARIAADEASRAKSQFLANMSHEIRTPMTVFMVALEHLLLIDRNPERRKLLEMAGQSAQRLHALIDDILDISRIEARKVDLEEEPFDLRGCVQSTVEMMRFKAQEKNLPLEIDLSPDLPSLVLGDQDRLGQILFNLVGNAIKFTDEGKVEVSVRVRENGLEFTVSDTGVGIPEDKRDLIFQSFSQADSSFRRKFGGSGLGLAISQGLVHLMGGEIGVRSWEGRGSVFHFTLPLKTVPQRSPEPAAEQVEARGAESQGARVLLAEDEPMIRDLILTSLARGGWFAEAAENGLEAVRKWEKGGFDLIIMDLQMPGLNGIEATRQIRGKKGGHHICIIGLTAHVSREVKEECLAAGMDKVLTKPVQIKELFSTIDSCLSERKQER